MKSLALLEAQQRIAHCLGLDEQGQVVQRHDHLNLHGLGLSDDDNLEAAFEEPRLDGKAISLAELTGLRYLDLTGNNLTRLPACVATFKELVWLGLNFNRLEQLPEEIGALTQLRCLYLRGNALTKLPDRIGELKSLVELDLSGNAFSQPDRALLRLLQDIEKGEGREFFLSFEDNPGEFTLRAKDGIPKFREHLQGLIDRGIEVREGKLLLVGEGRMGKSTLLHALLGLPFVSDRPQTHGLRMLPLPLKARGGEVRLNCWDFSGQKELRETHQIFFTEPAIYLVVWNAAQPVDAEDLRQWLWLIKHRTNGRGRALVVATNTYMNPRPLTGENKLREEFGGEDGILLQPEFFYVECNERCAGGQKDIDKLRNRLVEMIEADASFCQQTLPAWHKTQEDLAAIANEGKRERYLSWSKFEEFCMDRKIPADDVRRFAQHQHEVGRLVWLDRGAMKENVILSPDWLSKALGYIVRARHGEDPAEQAGLMSESRIHSIWGNPGLEDDEGNPEPGMPAEMFPAFRTFMEEFDMAHVTTQADGVRRYLIPQRLLPNPPVPWWRPSDDFAAPKVLLRRRIDIKGFDGKRGLNQWLLRAFFFRLIVRFHPYLVGRESGSLSANWEQGFCFAESYCGTARVQSDKHHLIFEAAGPRPEKLWHRLSIAVEELCKDLKDLTRTQIRMDLLVPCKSDCVRSATTRGYLPESVVLKSSSDGLSTLGCKGDDCYEQLSVKELVEGVKSTNCGSSDSENLREILKGVGALQMGVDNLIHAGQEDRIVAAERHTSIEANVGALASAIRSGFEMLDDSLRVGPSLFLVVPRDPSFLKDRGRMFASQFRLYLFCERLLKPVSFLDGTRDFGVFDFEMNHELWERISPYVNVTGRLLAALLPAAGLCLPGTVSIDPSVNDFKALAEQTVKLFEGEPTPTMDCFPSPLNAGDIWQSSPVRADRATLTWLHDFLTEKCGKKDLTTARKLGLQRVKDKTNNRYLWVHHTQM